MKHLQARLCVIEGTLTLRHSFLGTLHRMMRQSSVTMQPISPLFHAIIPNQDNKGGLQHPNEL